MTKANRTWEDRTTSGERGRKAKLLEANPKPKFGLGTLDRTPKRDEPHRGCQHDWREWSTAGMGTGLVQCPLCLAFGSRDEIRHNRPAAYEPEPVAQAGRS